MCGLVGIVGANLHVLHHEAFKWMLHLDTIRGEDSTGVALRKSFNKGRSQVIVAKTEGHPSLLTQRFPELFDKKGVLHLKTTERYDFLMGHNRAATVGAVNSTNAHPFHHGNITGCHNGTIGAGLLQLPSGDEIKGHTDSEKLIFALSKGWKIKEIMDTVTGAAAMTWWDASTKTYNIYRNKERSLFYTHNDTNTIFAYASEEWILRVSLNKNKLFELAKNIKEFPVDTLKSIKLGENKIEEVTTTVVAPLVMKAVIPTGTGNVHQLPHKNKKLSLQKHEKPTWLQEAIDKTEPFRGDSGWLDLSDLSKKDFDYNARFGCAACQVDLDYDDHLEGFVKWMEKDTPFCLTCSKTFKTA